MKTNREGQIKAVAPVEMTSWRLKNVRLNCMNKQLQEPGMELEVAKTKKFFSGFVKEGSGRIEASVGGNSCLRKDDDCTI